MKNVEKKQSEKVAVIPQEIRGAGEPAPARFEYAKLRTRVNAVIEKGLNDMWLLIDGEEMDTSWEKGIWKDGKAFAMITGDQVSLLGSRFSAVNALLSVGISMH